MASIRRPHRLLTLFLTAVLLGSLTGPLTGAPALEASPAAEFPAVSGDPASGKLIYRSRSQIQVRPLDGRSDESVGEPSSELEGEAQPGAAVSFVVDGDFYDGDFGLGDDDLNARQALYLNRFTPPSFPLLLERVEIFFACNNFDGTGDCLGREIEIVVVEDTDGDADLQTGAQTVAVRPGIIQTVDQVNFSVYDLDPPVQLEGPGDIFVGFIPRFIESGVTQFTLPAAAESVTLSQGRSWLVSWTGDPPDPPTFPADSFTGTVNSFGFNANLKIRAFGSVDGLGCQEGPTTLCLGEGGRFRVQVGYDTQQGSGAQGLGQALPLGSLGVEDGGVFWFFNQHNPELLVKVLDACARPEPHYWVFFAATTTVGFELAVTDMLTGIQKTYQNPDLQRADAVTDTRAFATCP